jgi:hypothetical protein
LGNGLLLKGSLWLSDETQLSYVDPIYLFFPIPYYFKSYFFQYIFFSLFHITLNHIFQYILFHNPFTIGLFHLTLLLSISICNSNQSFMSSQHMIAVFHLKVTENLSITNHFPNICYFLQSSIHQIFDQCLYKNNYTIWCW